MNNIKNGSSGVFSRRTYDRDLSEITESSINSSEINVALKFKMKEEENTMKRGLMFLLRELLLKKLLIQQLENFKKMDLRTNKYNAFHVFLQTE